jgi:hypothetical protein
MVFLQERSKMYTLLFTLKKMWWRWYSSSMEDFKHE